MNARTEIPKRIIQTGKNADLPLLNRAAVVNLKSLNPDFEHLFFDDGKVDAFFDEEPVEHREFLKLMRFPIQKYDFFRYLVIYRYGGFYFDLDVFLAAGLAKLREHGCVFSFEELNISRFLRQRYGMDWGVGNYGFGAAPGHPFLKAVIENCLRAQKDPKWVEPMMREVPRLFRTKFQVLSTTGPLLVSRTLAENPDLAQAITVLFPDDVCDRRNWHNFGTIGVHLMEGTWRGEDGRVRRRLASMWEEWSLQRLMKQSVRLGKTRQVAGNEEGPER